MAALRRPLVAALVVLLLLGACGEEDAAAPAADDPATAADDPAATEEPAAAEEPGATEEPGVAEEPGAAEEPGTEEPAATEQADKSDGGALAVADSDLGEILVDGDGRTVYMFEPDEQGEPTCVGDCAQAWPPVTADGEPEPGAGVDPALLGTVEHPGAGTQLTYDGWPLYHWAGDEAPGDLNGQGVNDVWWVLDAEGSPIREAAAAGAPY